SVGASRASMKLYVAAAHGAALERARRTASPGASSPPARALAHERARGPTRASGARGPRARAGRALMASRVVGMGKAWILDTETKGAGAQVAPLQKRGRPARERELATVRLARPPRPTEAPERPLPRKFKVLDVMSGRVLAEGVGAPAVVELLEGA